MPKMVVVDIIVVLGCWVDIPVRKSFRLLPVKYLAVKVVANPTNTMELTTIVLVLGLSIEALKRVDSILATILKILRELKR